MLASCAGSDVKQTSDGVIVNIKQEQPTDVRKVRLQVKGEKLIRVSATPDNTFSNRESLIIVPQQVQTPFSVEQTDSTVAVVTSEVRAIVNKTTG